MSAPVQIPTIAYECWFGALEPLYWGDIAYVFEFEGRLDEERLDRAVRTAIAAEPMWAYRFRRSWFYPVWRRSTPEELRSLVSVLCTDDPGRELQQALSKPVDAAVCLTVLRSHQGDRLLVRVDHRLADATAGRLMINEIRRFYDANVAEPTADILAPVVHRTIRLIREVTKREDHPALLAEKRRQKKEERQLRTFRIAEATKDDPYSAPRILCYGTGSAEELTARAMRERCTLVMAVAVATHLAVRDVVAMSPTDPHRVFMNVDLRRYLPREQQSAPAANLVGEVFVDFPARPDTRFLDALQCVRQQLTAQRGPYFALLGGAHLHDVSGILDSAGRVPFGLVRWLAKMVLRSYASAPRTVISDLGTIGSMDELWGDLPLKNGYCTLGVCQIPAVFVGISICQSQLSLSLGSGPNSFVSQLVDRIDHHLCDFAGWEEGTARRVILQPESSP